MRLSIVIFTGLLSMLSAIISSAWGSGRIEQLHHDLESYVADKDARIGIALITDGGDTVSVNGREMFAMMSVFKFPIALAVADFCHHTGRSFSDTLSVAAYEIKENTWSPMRVRYGCRDLRLPLSELLEYALQQSDNNACDILLRLVGGPETADSLITSEGFADIHIRYTEDDMHSDTSLCYDNSSSPLEMARLFNYFNREMRQFSPEHIFIASVMEKCATGTDRIAAPLAGYDGILVGHKTGTGDVTASGRISAINDCGYIILPDGRSYSLAVFINDSGYDISATSSLIADISAMIYRWITDHD